MNTDIREVSEFSPLKLEAMEACRLMKAKYAADPEIEWVSIMDIDFESSPTWIDREIVDDIFLTLPQRGLDEPLDVERSGGRYAYEIIDGWARYIAALAMGLNLLPARIWDLSEV